MTWPMLAVFLQVSSSRSWRSWALLARATMSSAKSRSERFFLSVHFILLPCVVSFISQSVASENRRGNIRVAKAQRKQGIWMSIFPNRENTGNLATMQGKIENTGKNFNLFHFYFVIFSLYYCFCLFQASPVEILPGGRGSIVVLQHCTKNQ